MKKLNNITALKRHLNLSLLFTIFLLSSFFDLHAQRNTELIQPYVGLKSLYVFDSGISNFGPEGNLGISFSINTKVSLSLEYSIAYYRLNYEPDLDSISNVLDPLALPPYDQNYAQNIDQNLVARTSYEIGNSFYLQLGLSLVNHKYRRSYVGYRGREKYSNRNESWRFLYQFNVGAFYMVRPFRIHGSYTYTYSRARGKVFLGVDYLF